MQCQRLHFMQLWERCKLQPNPGKGLVFEVNKLDAVHIKEKMQVFQDLRISGDKKRGRKVERFWRFESHLCLWAAVSLPLGIPLELTMKKARAMAVVLILLTFMVNERIKLAEIWDY